ncbi:AAA family ATPase [Roseibium sp. RKSG952]|uniref:AAA family ATPase n=1 Tax=Roseibium sp. RKSG952 TaxID=2529384 RepID=UPI0012BBE298|nr:AAA family ATPase [Roseibium sp. RKSG952]MTH95251.1 AAA family ATPase [Roseibium sp. RKSG952]
MMDRSLLGPGDEFTFSGSGSQVRPNDLPDELVGQITPSVRVVGDRAAALGLGSRDFEGGRFDTLLQSLPIIPAPDPDLVYETLMDEFPWMEEANEAVAMACAVSDRRDPKYLRIPPLMLVGPSGAGKSRWSRRMAEVMDIHYHRENMAGVYGTMEISGSAYGWKDARPSLPAVVMAAGMIANPIILLDEIDKTAAESAGDPVEALLPMLEEETARSYSDPCLMVPVDLSMISFLLTANSESSLGTPFMDRLKMVRAMKPTVAQFERTLPTMFDGIAARLKVDNWNEADDLLGRTLRVYLNGGSLRSALAFAEQEISALVWRPKRPGGHLKLI